MNKKQKNVVSEIVEGLEAILDDVNDTLDSNDSKGLLKTLKDVCEAEKQAYDRLSETAQESEKGEEMEDNIDELENAISTIEKSFSGIEEYLNEIDEAKDALDDLLY